MLTLLLASAAAATAPLPPINSHMPNFYQEPASCPAVVAGELARQLAAFHGRRPLIEYAVYRRLFGCAVPTPIGYHPAPAPKR